MDDRVMLMQFLALAIEFCFLQCT